MPNLKNDRFLIAFVFCISGCQSASIFSLNTFHEEGKNPSSDFHVIRLRPNRIQQKCIFLNAEDENNWRHQYLLYVLDEKNNVLEIMQPIHQDKDSCYSQINKINKIIKHESQIKLCVRDELKKSTLDSENKPIQFGNLGHHRVTYKYLTLDSVCNSKNCFSNNEVWTNTCPEFKKY